MKPNDYLPHEVQIVARVQEAPDIFTLRLRFTDLARHARYHFDAGQFNMLYLHGVGEIAISIASDPKDTHLIDHTVRVVGRVTKALAQLQTGDYLGLRGPFGRGWPMAAAQGRDILLITGGLGCAPVVSVVHYVLRRRAHYSRLVIMQGVKHTHDLIWRRQYDTWAATPNTQVLLTADQTGQGWPFNTGLVTQLLGQAQFDPANALAMLCGPEGMMRATVHALQQRGVPDHDIWLSMERNMHCAVGHCGHCQFGGSFICKDGPVYPLPEISHLLGVKGF